VVFLLLLIKSFLEVTDLVEEVENECQSEGEEDPGEGVEAVGLQEGQAGAGLAPGEDLAVGWGGGDKATRRYSVLARCMAP